MIRQLRALTIVAATAAGVALAAEPPQPLTADSYDRHLQAWMATKLEAEFVAHGKKDAAWAQDLRAFFPAFTMGLVPQFRDPALTEQLDARAAALAKAGCDDPLFQACQARIAIARKRQRAAEIALRPLPGKLQAAGYPPFCRLLALLWANRARTELGVNRPPPPEFGEMALAAAADADFTGFDKLLYVRSVLPDDGGLLALAAERFARPDSGIDEWITALVTGRNEINKAWQARGAGFAGEVKPEAWQVFGQHLALAREQLTKAHELHPEFPEAAAAMITVSVGDRSGEEQLWFDRAVAAQFDYQPAYERMISMALLPRWGGSHEQMLAFGRKCLATGRFDTIVPASLFVVALQISRELPDRYDAFALPGLSEDCVQVLSRYAAVDPSPAGARVWKSRLALLHWATGRYAEAAAVLDDLGDELAAVPLEEFQAKAADVIGESRLFAGPHADAVEAAEALIAAARVDAALAAYERIAALDGIPPAGRRLVASRIVTLERAVALERYDWVDLQPAADLAGWHVVAGDWRVEADGTLVGSTPGQGRLKLASEVDLGPDVEFTLECDLGGRPAG